MSFCSEPTRKSAWAFLLFWLLVGSRATIEAISFNIHYMPEKEPNIYNGNEKEPEEDPVEKYHRLRKESGLDNSGALSKEDADAMKVAEGKGKGSPDHGVAVEKKKSR